MKKIITLIISAVLLFTNSTIILASNSGMDNFKKVNTYKNNFSDVFNYEWYSSDVKQAYEYGLMNGINETTFNPKGNITLAETITLAARLHNTYYGGEYVFNPSTPWYKCYVDYAIQNNIVDKSWFANYNSIATRAQFALVFANALPDNELTAINDVREGEIPDVSKYETFFDEVCKLYNAGILTGNDGFGTFTPSANIQRSEVATIVNRMANKSMRKTFTLFGSLSTNEKEKIVLKVGESKPGIQYRTSPENLDITYEAYLGTPNRRTAQPADEYVSISSDGTVTGLKPVDDVVILVYCEGDYWSQKKDIWVGVEKESVEIIVKDTLPKELGNYAYNGDIECGLEITDVRYEVTDYTYTDEQTVTLYFTGRKIAAVGNKKISSFCKIAWKLYDEEGYVVDSDTAYTSAIAVDEKFRDVKDIIFDLKPGKYYLELNNAQ